MMQVQRLIVGMDWGDEKHAVFLVDEVTGKRSHQEVEHTPEAIAEWIVSLRRHQSSYTTYRVRVLPVTREHGIPHQSTLC
ncbi:MAG: IS110 family transposase [Pirellulaceae bacterium]